MFDLLLSLFFFWPLGAGLLVGALLPRGHRWLALAGVAAAVAAAVVALAFASDEGGLYTPFSEQDFLLMAAILWGGGWAVGVPAGREIAHARAERRGTRRATPWEGEPWPPRWPPVEGGGERKDGAAR
ncbi:MAG: hypothetical protein ICV64_05590 [Thermoleophilia bacterium]|nr:hypothetical protein [Thermoleophilia bacterium]